MSLPILSWRKAKPLPTPAPIVAGGHSEDPLIAANRPLAKRLHSLYGLLRPGFESEAIKPMERALNMARKAGADEEALMLTLHCGVFGYQSAMAVPFCKDVVPSQRRVIEPAWHFGAYIACLAFALRKNHGIANGTILEGLLDPTLMYAFDLVPTLREVVLDSLDENRHQTSPRFRDLVRNTYWRIIQARNGIDSPSSHRVLVEYFLRSLRTLGRLPTWQPNAEKTRLWVGRDGAFLIWPAAFPLIEEQLVAENLPMPIPDQLGLARELVSAGLAAMLHEAVHPYIQIRPPRSADKVFDAIELKNLPLWSENLQMELSPSHDLLRLPQ